MAEVGWTTSSYCILQWEELKCERHNRPVDKEGWLKVRTRNYITCIYVSQIKRSWITLNLKEEGNVSGIMRPYQCLTNAMEKENVPVWHLINQQLQMKASAINDSIQNLFFLKSKVSTSKYKNLGTEFQLN